jgi:hypothetical protein
MVATNLVQSKGRKAPFFLDRKGRAAKAKEGEDPTWESDKHKFVWNIFSTFNPPPNIAEKPDEPPKKPDIITKKGPKKRPRRKRRKMKDKRHQDRQKTLKKDKERFETSYALWTQGEEAEDNPRPSENNGDKNNEAGVKKGGKKAFNDQILSPSSETEKHQFSASEFLSERARKTYKACAGTDGTYYYEGGLNEKNSSNDKKNYFDSSTKKYKTNPVRNKNKPSSNSIRNHDKQPSPINDPDKPNSIHDPDDGSPINDYDDPDSVNDYDASGPESDPEYETNPGKPSKMEGKHNNGLGDRWCPPESIVIAPGNTFIDLTGDDESTSNADEAYTCTVADVTAVAH